MVNHVVAVIVSSVYFRTSERDKGGFAYRGGKYKEDSKGSVRVEFQDQVRIF